MAIPAGMVLAVGAGALTLLTDVAHGEHPLTIASVFTFVMCWGFIGLVWVFVVDRSSLQGAIERPEESVESQ